MASLRGLLRPESVKNSTKEKKARTPLNMHESKEIMDYNNDGAKPYTDKQQKKSSFLLSLD